MKAYLPEIIQLVVGLLVMALLLFLGACSHGWVALLCFLGTAVVYFGWYHLLIKLARRVSGYPEDDDDQPFFPG